MLGEEEKRFKIISYVHTNQVGFLVQNAENLADIPEEFVNTYTIAFGICKCTRVCKVVKEAYRVSKKRGHFICFEFSKGLRYLLIGAIADVHGSYQYPVENIHKFPPQAEFVQIICNAGFKTVGKRYEYLAFGVIATCSDYKA